MRNLPVHWSEGLFLRPHHFQASDRHWAELVSTSQQWGNCYHYGIQALEISPEAIANSQLQVDVCHARMKDGTIITLVSQELGDLERLLMLTKLNEAYSLLGVLAFAQGVHPFSAYSELCRIVGQLSIFDQTRCPPKIPQYDHDDLGRIFHYIKEQIERLLGHIRDYQYEQRFFIGEGNGMRVNFESQWLGDNWQWFVGAQATGLGQKEILALLSPGRLDWKLGSAMQVDAMFRHGAEGVQLTPLAQTPRALSPSKDWAYFEVTRGNAAWKNVLDTETLAMRLRNDQIDNRDNLQGERKLVISVGTKKIPMQFALFAVPNL